MSYVDMLENKLKEAREEIERQRAVISELAELVEQETARVKQKHELIERAKFVIEWDVDELENYNNCNPEIIRQAKEWLKDAGR